MQAAVLNMKHAGFGSPLRNVGTSGLWDFNPLDFGDIVDALSLRTVHPISYAAELVFDDTVDQKLEEALLHYSLTGTPYDALFIDHAKILDSGKVLDWLDLDLLTESQVDIDENSFGLGYDLLLVKNVPEYWQVILEADSNWDDLYQTAYPQIHDNVDNMFEYLPV